MQCQLKAQVGASALDVPWSNLSEWKAVLNCAESLELHQNGRFLLGVDLNDTRRWIAFQADVNGSNMHVIGYQETVGAIHHGGLVTGGSNRKVLAWRRPDGTFFIGEEPR